MFSGLIYIISFPGNFNRKSNTFHLNRFPAQTKIIIEIIFLILIDLQKFLKILHSDISNICNARKYEPQNLAT